MRSVLWLACGLLLACRQGGGTSDDRETSKPSAPAASRPFEFVLPDEYVPLELRGEGSEVLRAPPGASVRAIGEGFSVTAGSDFALAIEANAPSLAELEAKLSTSTIAVKADDLLVVEQAGGLEFVVIAELVPEWDESDRRRLSCSGKAPPAASAERSRSAVEKMVAACRSLGLPRLEVQGAR